MSSTRRMLSCAMKARATIPRRRASVMASRSSCSIAGSATATLVPELDAILIYRNALFRLGVGGNLPGRSGQHRGQGSDIILVVVIDLDSARTLAAPANPPNLSLERTLQRI